eukprot:10495189-Alexandrium_andersonii.AAC.1
MRPKVASAACGVSLACSGSFGRGPTPLLQERPARPDAPQTGRDRRLKSTPSGLGPSEGA